MSIRLQVFLNIILIFVILGFTTFFSARFLILQNLEAAEENVVFSKMEGLQELLEREVIRLDSTTVDWASWDDTYEFIQDKNQGFIEDNIDSNPFGYLELNLMVYLDLTGDIVYEIAYDIENAAIADVPAAVHSYFTGNTRILKSSEGKVSGFLLLPELPPLLLAIRPILPSMEDGPARGILVFGRFMNSSQVESLNIYSDSIVSIFTPGDENIADDVTELLAADVPEEESPVIKTLDEKTIAGYIRAKDIEGNTAVLRMEMPRDIYIQGEKGIRYLMIGLAGVSIIVLAIVMIVTNKVGLSRLRKLAVKVDKIGALGSISERVDVEMNDEISSLAKNINNMLASLEELYKKEAELSHQLESEMTRRVDFVRSLVHELRTPLTPVLTTSEMLLERVKEEPDKSMVENIHWGAVRLNKRITELLDFTRSEVGGLEINISPINPAGLIRESVSDMEPEAAQRKKTVTLEIPDRVPDIKGDEDRLKQVMTNLLDNAIKYSVRGDTIIVRVKTEPDNLIVEVEDHGPGIDEENQKKLFTPYYRVDRDKNRAGGLGLGLQLCKKIIELHNGKIWLRSRKGEGATFGFSIPLDLPVSEKSV